MVTSNKKKGPLYLYRFNITDLCLDLVYKTWILDTLLLKCHMTEGLHPTRTMKNAHMAEIHVRKYLENTDSGYLC